MGQPIAWTESGYRETVYCPGRRTAAILWLGGGTLAAVFANAVLGPLSVAMWTGLSACIVVGVVGLARPTAWVVEIGAPGVRWGPRQTDKASMDWIPWGRVGGVRLEGYAGSRKWGNAGTVVVGYTAADGSEGELRIPSRYPDLLCRVVLHGKELQSWKKTNRSGRTRGGPTAARAQFG